MVKQYGIDYGALAGSMKKEEKSQAVNKIAVDNAVRGRMVKVAFDVYNIENDPYDTLWKLETAEDGKEYLTRMDDGEAVETKTGGWAAISNEAGNSITLSYKGVPIQRLSGKIFGFDKKDVGLFKKALLEKVASNDGFKNKLIEMQPEEKKSELYRAFPELVTK